MSDNQMHSTGRGGAGNIGPGEGVYAPGSIVREGPLTDEQHTPAYSSGRGGAGNISSDPAPSSSDAAGANGQQQQQHNKHGHAHLPHLSDLLHPHHHQKNHQHPSAATAAATTTTASAATSQAPISEDSIPQLAMRQVGEGYENFHTGRGGEGNIYRERYGGHSAPQGSSSKK